MDFSVLRRSCCQFSVNLLSSSFIPTFPAVFVDFYRRSNARQIHAAWWIFIQVLFERPAAVGFDDGVNFGHESDGFGEGNDDFVVVGDFPG